MPFQQLTQPGQFLRIAFVRPGSRIGTAAFLIPPVSGDTEFTDTVHLECTNLDLQRLAVGKGHCSMQGLVHVGLRYRNIIFEPSRNRAPQPVHNPQRSVTVLYCIHQYTDGQQVINLIQFFMVPHHFFINTVEIFGTTLDLTTDINPVQFLAQGLHGVVDHGFPFFPFCLNLLYQIVIQFRIPVPEGHVLQFPLDCINTQAISQRRINFQGFLGNGLLLVNRHVFHGPHVVQTVRQFYDNHPDILGHGQEHLTVIFNLPFFFGNILNFSQLGHAVYQHGYFRAKHFLELLKSSIRILHHIMQKRGSQRLLIHFHLGEDIGNLDWMNNIRLAGTPLLICMHLSSKVIGFFNEGDLLFIKIGFQKLKEFFNGYILVLFIGHTLFLPYLRLQNRRLPTGPVNAQVSQRFRKLWILAPAIRKLL